MFRLVRRCGPLLASLFILSSCLTWPQKDRSAPKQLILSAELKPGLNPASLHDGQKLLLYLPSYPLSTQSNPKILVIIHGFLKINNIEQGLSSVHQRLTPWIPFARRSNFILLAPLFDSTRFRNDFQRLNMKGPRADLRLNDIIIMIKELIPEIKAHKINLFGFSGGGQFVHRYVAFHPDMVQAAVAAAAGWYLWPDPDLPYPLGLKISKFNKLEKPRLKDMMSAPLLILVGENDRTQSSFRTIYHSYNLNQLQGESRFERALNWFQAMRNASTEQNFSIQLHVVPQTEHNISPQMLNMARNFITEHNK
ncbi:alpha/beta hydrolase family protein [candidate division CSSED10-310 bacterium]|uniref:Alpha/beta hydrolase family protein n=1 Tax=candidate division CSSED10-310 bacterium TaxID=2855610 RepID=A0ABV6YXS2_UNCC1